MLISMVKRFKYRYYILGNMCSDNVPNSMVPYGFSIWQIEVLIPWRNLNACCTTRTFNIQFGCKNHAYIEGQNR